MVSILDFAVIENNRFYMSSVLFEIDHVNVIVVRTNYATEKAKFKETQSNECSINYSYCQLLYLFVNY